MGCGECRGSRLGSVSAATWRESAIDDVAVAFRHIWVMDKGYVAALDANDALAPGNKSGLRGMPLRGALFVKIWKKDELFYLRCPTARYISASICAYEFGIAARKRSERPHSDTIRISRGGDAKRAFSINI